MVRLSVEALPAVQPCSRRDAAPSPECDENCDLQVATALLQAIRDPIVLRWEVTVPGGGIAALSAKIEPTCQSTQLEWPPRHLAFNFSHGGTDPANDPTPMDAEIQVPSDMQAFQFQAVLAGCRVACKTQNEVSEHQEQVLSGVKRDTVPDSSEAYLLHRDPERCISQFRCLHQWHHNVCGHHALFNIRQLLQGFDHGEQGIEVDSGLLLDEARFWMDVAIDTHRLVQHGAESKRWMPSRVTGGMLDEVHLRYIIENDTTLRDRTSVVASVDALQTGGAAKHALEQVAAEQRGVHAFILGCAVHWIAVVVSNVRPLGPKIWICDSYNRPLASIATQVEAHDAAKLFAQGHTETLRNKLSQSPAWQHHPPGHIDRVLEEGVEEWWKGILKSSLFWTLKPQRVRLELRIQECEMIQRYLSLCASILLPCRVAEPEHD